MKTVIKYKVFTSSKEFEKWQEDNPQYGIYQMSPYQLSSGISLAEKNGSLSGGVHLEVGLFVCYGIPLEKGE